MKIHFISLGEGKRDIKQFKFLYSGNIKTLQLYLYIFGIIFSFGKLDIVSVYDRKVQEEKSMQNFYENSNRAERRRFLHQMKKAKRNHV